MYYFCSECKQRKRCSSTNVKTECDKCVNIKLWEENKKRGIYIIMSNSDKVMNKQKKIKSTQKKENLEDLCNNFNFF